MAIACPHFPLGEREELALVVPDPGASANDLLVLFTDGLFEVETAEDDYYGADRLLAAMGKRMHLAAAQLIGEVVAEIQGSCISGQFTDDICLLGVEVRRTGLADSSQKVA